LCRRGRRRRGGIGRTRRPPGQPACIPAARFRNPSHRLSLANPGPERAARPGLRLGYYRDYVAAAPGRGPPDSDSTQGSRPHWARPADWAKLESRVPPGSGWLHRTCGTRDNSEPAANLSDSDPAAAVSRGLTESSCRGPAPVPAAPAPRRRLAIMRSGGRGPARRRVARARAWSLEAPAQSESSPAQVPDCQAAPPPGPPAP
jgi:hypothetical protein